uniref:Uncharacterized protein n=1 Tax=Mammaliicoccus phage MSShimriz1 TaxID=3230127 RepID=A0AAU8GTA4_9VIRU
MKKNKRKTLGKMSHKRAVWDINPVTRVTKDKTKYSRKKKHKDIDKY